MSYQRLLPLFFLLLLPSLAGAQKFTLHKLTADQPGPTVLVIGGIHGDEPGGFNAAALLMTRYQFHSGKLWVVPDLNRISILRRAHGWFGDMNYKFNGLHKTDMDYRTVQQIKKLIAAPQVDLIFNLHDGSGFYSPQKINSQRNPDRWGQSCVIDQAELEATAYGKLELLSQRAAAKINQQLLHPEHRFHVKNTRTATSSATMQKSLTYFALRSQKPAIGLEASKQLPVNKRVYYLLTALEAYLQQLNISFSRDFELTPQAIGEILSKEIDLTFAEGQIKLPLNNLRPLLTWFPLEKGRSLDYQSNSPLVWLRKNGKRLRIHFGNNRLAFLQPEYLDYDRSLTAVTMQIDGQNTEVRLGEQIEVKDDFKVIVPAGYRANVIGFHHPQAKNDAGQTISRKRLDSNYSIDNAGQIYRVEIYRQKKFCGMNS